MKYILLFLLPFFIGSCTETIQLQPGNYQMTCGYKESVYKAMKKTDRGSVGCNVACDHEIYHRSFLALNKDKTFVLAIEDVLMHGNYELVKNKVKLKDRDGSELILEIKEQRPDCIQLLGVFDEISSRAISANERLYFNFTLDSTKSVETDSKFSYEVNTWRIAPMDSESDAEIKTRLLNNLDYVCAYVQHVLNSGVYHGYKMDGIPTPLRYLENGIVLREWDDVPQSWKDIFYDESDAYRAYEMMYETFKNTEANRYKRSGLLVVFYYLKDLRNALSDKQ
ncbi:hypothetical protein [Sphingobacterium spiritivorum]|uniref:hypothetical protein n=1 Tax=Sphingobacterium spiritivorum TaxID=258 RepID=UPI003DA610C5